MQPLQAVHSRKGWSAGVGNESFLKRRIRRLSERRSWLRQSRAFTQLHCSSGARRGSPPPIFHSPESHTEVFSVCYQGQESRPARFRNTGLMKKSRGVC